MTILALFIPGIGSQAEAQGGLPQFPILASQVNAYGSPAVDPDGNIYVATRIRHTVLKIDPAGVTTLWAGLDGVSGTSNGHKSVALFNSPDSVVRDSLGNLFVSDSGNNVIRKIAPDGAVSLFSGQAGVTGGSTDGSASAARFNYPSAMAFGPDGFLYVCDRFGHVVRRVASDGSVTTIAGLGGVSGTDNGAGSAARFYYPNAIAVASDGTVYVGDATNTIRRIDSSGNVSTFVGAGGGLGYLDGDAGTAQFGIIAGLNFDASGNLLVADSSNQVVRRVTPGGLVTTVAGKKGFLPGNDGTFKPEYLMSPSGVMDLPGGYLLIIDSGNVRTNMPPVIGLAPASQMVHDGDAVTLEVQTKWVGASFQWTKDGVPLPGATSRILTIPSAMAEDAGSYRVTLTFGNLSAVPLPAVLTVISKDPYLFSTYAGSPGVTGSRGGSGGKFKNPQAVVLDAQGNCYIADTENYAIRKVTPDGLVSTIAGSPGNAGFVDGAGADARFKWPTSLTMDPAGFMWLCDSDTIRIVTLDGVVSTLAGNPDVFGNVDATGTAATFSGLGQIAVAPSGDLYVTNRGTHTVRKVTRQGVVSTFAGLAGTPGLRAGTGQNARLRDPYGLVVDSSGNLIGSDLSNYNIFKITPQAAVTFLAGPISDTGRFVGYVDGRGANAFFSEPFFMAVDSSGNAYVLDRTPKAIRKITPDGDVSTVYRGRGIYAYADGTPEQAAFVTMWGFTRTAAGDFFVTDCIYNTVRKISAAGVATTIAGHPFYSGKDDGLAPASLFNRPQGIAATGTTVLVADAQNHTVRSVISPSSDTRVGGWETQPGNTGSEDRRYSMEGPADVVVGPNGDVFVSDWGNSVIRKITPGGLSSVYAGAPRLRAYIDGSSGTARFDEVSGITVDGQGVIYILDTSRVRRVELDGSVSTYAGSGHYGTSEGPRLSAGFAYPRGIACASDGTLYIADTGASRIRKIAPDGTVSTFAGALNQAGFKDGVGGAARFNSPEGVAVDQQGNVFVADTKNHAVRMITPSGVVTTMGGQSGNPGTMDALGVYSRFNLPSKIAIDPSGVLYVSDTGSHTIRKGVLSPLNLAPTVTSLTNILVPAEGSSLAFEVADRETSAGSLGVTASSSNSSLFPPGSLVCSGNGQMRSLSLNPSTAITGTATITLSVSDGLRARSVSFQATVVTPKSYGAFVLARFGATTDVDGPQARWDADPDHDGVTNLVEYALGTDPGRVSSVEAPAPRINNGCLTLTYRRPIGLMDVTYTPEVATHLGGPWVSGSDYIEVVQQSLVSPEVEEITVRDKMPTQGSPSRFMRLRVSR